MAATDTTAGQPRRLWLISHNGAIIKPVGPSPGGSPANGEELLPQDDDEARRQTAEFVRQQIMQLPLSSRYRRRLGHLLAELEYEGPDDDLE